MIIPTERWLGGVKMPEPIEIMAQEMIIMRQSVTAMQARMESTQSNKSYLESERSNNSDIVGYLQKPK